MTATYDHAGFRTTRPRGPIAAQYSSPGPCYGLPGLVGKPKHDPRSVHAIRPAYIFGVKHGKFRDDCSPGPCYLPTAKYYRNGPDGTPCYSLYGRNRDLTCFKTPGPGAYSAEKTGPHVDYSAPQYSFGTRHRHRRTDNTPAPNNYTVTPMMGKTTESKKKQAPAYSLVGRSKIGSFHEDLSNSPGPCAYNVTTPNKYKRCPPEFSMTARNTLPGDNTRKPGPGAHSPENVYMNKKAAPRFSFGIRHSEYTAPLIVAAED